METRPSCAQTSKMQAYANSVKRTSETDKSRLIIAPFKTTVYRFMPTPFKQRSSRFKTTVYRFMPTRSPKRSASLCRKCLYIYIYIHIYYIKGPTASMRTRSPKRSASALCPYCSMNAIRSSRPSCLIATSQCLLRNRATIKKAGNFI